MDDWKLAVLQDFTRWLEELPEDGLIEEDGAEEGDLRTLFAEFTSLRQEIRLQSREQAKVVRNLEKVAEVGEQQLDVFHRHIQGLADLEERTGREAERRCLIPFLEVRDALVRGRDAASRVAGVRGLLRRTPPGIEGVVQGYEMAIERFDRALSQVGVQPVPSVGHPFQAEWMRAAETRTVAGVADGIVIEEFRTGFTRGDEVLRWAEVVVNRSEAREG